MFVSTGMQNNSMIWISRRCEGATQRKIILEPVSTSADQLRYSTVNSALEVIQSYIHNHNN